MRSISRFGFTCFASALLALAATQASAIPFSAETTTRESLPRAPYPTATPDSALSVTPTPVPQQLYDDSGELVFQKKDDGSIFLAYTSRDPAADNYYDDRGVYQKSRCTRDGVRQIYWEDRSSGQPARCISFNDWTQKEGSFDSSNPKIGGEKEETGRYIAFESEAPELFAVPSPTPNLTATPTPNPEPCSMYKQIWIHDRKWEDTEMSRPICDFEQYNNCGLGPNGDSNLDKISRNGSKILFSSAASKMWDNVEPECSDPYQWEDIFWRNGDTDAKKDACEDGMFGTCETNVIFDRYHFNADPKKIGICDGNSNRADWTPDNSMIAFQTFSSLPIGYLPDLLGYSDIFTWSGETFDRISNEQVLVTDDINKTSAYKNVGGPANGNSTKPRINATGKLVVFESQASNLVAEYSDRLSGDYNYKHVFLYNSDTETVQLISKNKAGVPGNGDSENAWISDDGRFIAFESHATNLMDGITTTPFKNIFVYDRSLDRIYLVTPGPNPTYDPAASTQVDTRLVQGLNADATITDIDPKGLTIAFATNATNAINSALPGVLADTNTKQDVFIAFNACPQDNDSDGVPNCLDNCPQDPLKNEPLQCGCGNLETDTDADGTADCVDKCPDQPAKTEPGQCGCAAMDTDTDKDGTADCTDGCPFDPDKASAGACGCGVSDADNNGNGVADCKDPSFDITPSSAHVRVSKKAGRDARAKIEGQGGFQKVIYTFTLKNVKTGRLLTKKSRNGVAVFNNLKKGRYSVKYVIKSGGLSTRSSAWKKFTVR